MKTISDSDHALLVEKLPAVLAAVPCSPFDTATANAVRRLGMLQRKLSRAAGAKRDNNQGKHKPV